MRNLKHERPQLRLLDNLRRELRKTLAEPASPSPELTWPEYWRPVVRGKRSQEALSELVEAIGHWTDTTAVISFSNPPLPLRQAAQAFAKVRLQNPYDPKYCGRNWIADLERSDREDARAWGALLAFFVRLSEDDE